jgi:GT2 family glycosyltransferase
LPLSAIESTTDPAGPEPAPVPHPAALAVVVSAGLTPYLPETLRGLAQQRQAPAAVLLVDVTPAPDPGHVRGSGLRAAAHGAGLALEWVRVVQAPGARTYGAAVRDGLARLGGQGGGGAYLARASWLWLLHDDSAPEREALAELLRVAESGPSIALVGSKQLDWRAPDELVSVGVTVSRGGRRFTGIEDGEIDQGQHDGREDVYAVGTAGLLVDRAVWEALGGTDPALGPFGDGLDLSRRARLAGYRVVVAPGATVRHARATYLGAREAGGTGAQPPDLRRSFRARRTALLHLRLVEAATWTLPLLVVAVAVGALVRALARVVTKEPGLAADELEAAAAVLVRPGVIRRARRRARETQRVSPRRLGPLRATWRQVWQVGHDRRLRAATVRRARRTPSDLELAERGALVRRRRRALALTVVVLAAVAALAYGPLVVGGPLTGGAVLPLTASAGELWQVATSSWVPTGDGRAGPPDPLLLVLAVLAAPLGGSAQAAVSTLLLASVPLAGLGAWFAAGAATRSAALRAWTAGVWALGPCLVLATGQGRLGAVVAHLALPWAALGLARALGVQARDVLPAVAATAPARQSPPAPDDPGTPAAERAVAAGPAAVAAPTGAGSPAAALGSPGAAAAAGLALAVAASGAPVLLLAALAALLVLALVVRRRRRYLLLAAVPPLALLAPTLLAAAEGEGAWRVLVADPGVPLASDAGAAYLPLLTWPALPVPWPVLPEPAASIAPLAAGGVVAVAALAAVLRVRRLRAVQAGWAVAVVGLAAALLAARADVAVGDAVGAAPGAWVVVGGWAGAGTSLVLLGLLLAVVAATDGLRVRLSAVPFGWRQVGASVLTVALVVAPAANAVALTWRTVEARTTAGPEVVLAIAGRASEPVPALGLELQGPPLGASVLALVPGAELVVELWRDDGGQLDEQSTTAAARALAGPPAATVVVDPDGADTSLAAIAAGLAAGTAGDPRAELAAHAVGVVVVPPGGGEERDEVVAHLDATVGLERVTENASGVVYRVAPPAGSPGAARVAVTAADGRTLHALPAGIVGARGRVPEGEPGRRLVLAERADPGWRATLDGEPLAPTSAGWRQTFLLGERGGRLVVTHEDWWLTLVHTVQAVVLGLFVLLALPLRRRRWEGE